MLVDNWQWTRPALGTHNIRSIAVGIAAAEAAGLPARRDRDPGAARHGRLHPEGCGAPGLPGARVRAGGRDDPRHGLPRPAPAREHGERVLPSPDVRSAPGSRRAPGAPGPTREPRPPRPRQVERAEAAGRGSRAARRSDPASRQSARRRAAALLRPPPGAAAVPERTSRRLLPGRHPHGDGEGPGHHPRQPGPRLRTPHRRQVDLHRHHHPVGQPGPARRGRRQRSPAPPGSRPTGPSRRPARPSPSGATLRRASGPTSCSRPPRHARAALRAGRPRGG